MNNMYRVGVKMDGMKRYKAVVENNGGIAIAPSPNKLYHSFFTKENAEKLVKEMQEAGFDVKILA